MKLKILFIFSLFIPVAFLVFLFSLIERPPDPRQIVQDRYQALNTSEKEKIMKRLQTPLNYIGAIAAGQTDYFAYFKDSKIEWTGQIATHYSSRDGIKFCIVDDQHQNIDSGGPCDWFWAIPPELGTENSPEKQAGWDGGHASYVFKHYSDIDPDTIDVEKDTFLITGKLESIDFEFDYLNRPIPNIVVEKIERI